MLKCPEKAVGQKVTVNDKVGTLRFVGTTNFASGIWCGIELDEAAGENDGTVNNVQYFTCRKNHGIFIPASDLIFPDNGSVETNLTSADHFPDRLSNTNFDAQNYNCTIMINDSQSVSPKILDKKNESYTISKEAPFGNLSTIIEEMNPNSITISCLDIENELNKCNTFFNEVCNSTIQKQDNSVFHQSFEEYDSDDSLGILPFQILEDTQSGDNLFFEIDNTEKHLNSIVNLSSGSEKGLKCQILTFHDNNDEFLFPSTSILPKYPILSMNEECPANMPKSASTPKHEINYSYVIDEGAIVSGEKYNLESPINASETFLGKHLELVLNITTEMALNSENESSTIGNECKSRNFENRIQAQDILNTTCIISDPVNENVIPLNKFNCAVVEGYSVKSHKDLVKFSIQDNPLPDYKNFVQNIVPNGLNDAASCYSQENKEDGNVLNVTCNILEPKQIGNRHDENILNVTCNIFESKQVENEDDENILNVTCNILEPKQIGNEDDENILNVTCNILEPKQIANYTENLDDKNCLPTNILNATVSYFDIAENNNIANNKAEILNTTVSYFDIAENNNIANNKAEILNTTVSYSEKPDDDIVENVNSDILNTTYQKIEEPSELGGNVKILRTIQPPFKSNKTQSRKSVGCFVEPRIVNAEYKSKARRNSSSSSLRPKSKAGESTINKPRRNSVSSSLDPTSKTNESTVNYFNKNLHGKYPVEIKKTVRKSFVNGSQLPNPNSSFNVCRNAYNCLSVKSNFTKNNHEIIDSISEDKLKDGQVFNKTESFSPLLDVCKTVVKKPRFSVQNFTDNNHKIIDSNSEGKLSNGQVFSETESFSPLLPDVGKTIIKKARFSVQNFTKNNPEIIDSISKVKLNDDQVFNETENFSSLLDVRKTVVKKSRFSTQRFTGYEHGKTNLVSENKDGQTLAKTKNHDLPDGGKTVVKKPQCCENFGYKSNLQGPCKKSLFKPQSKTVASASENKSLKVPTITKKELPVQKTFKDSAIPCFKRPVFSGGTSDEKNYHISRIPERCVLSQKNILVNSTPMETNGSNLPKPHSFIPAAKTFCNKELDQASTRNSQNSYPNCAKKSCLNETVILPNQKHNNEENQNCKALSKSTKPVSRIPSIGQNNRKANSGVKSSLMIPRIAYKGKGHYQQNIR